MSTLHSGFSHALEILVDQSISPDLLYEKWWSGPRSASSISTIDTNFHQDLPSRFLSRLGTTEIHSLGHTAVALEPGDFYYSGNGFAVIKRRQHWSSEHFIWRQGIQPSVYPFNSQTIRAYIPSHLRSNISLATEIGDQLDRFNLPFQLKFRREKEVYRDSIVMWVDEHFLRQSNAVVANICGQSQAIVLPPPLTFHVGAIGYSESPHDGSSPGWNFSKLLWSISKTKRLKEISELIIDNGYDPVKPWRFRNGNGSAWEEQLS